MSLRKKRKSSAPGRLASPFVDHDEIDDDGGDTTRRATMPFHQQQRRGSGGNRNLFSRITNSSNQSSSSSSSFGFERNGTIAEETVSPNIDVFVNDVDNNNHHHLGHHQYWGDADEDEGYNSPHPSPRRAASPSSPQSPPVEEPDNPGELTLHYLVCSFVAESERKINAFLKSVSFLCKKRNLWRPTIYLPVFTRIWILQNLFVNVSSSGGLYGYSGVCSGVFSAFKVCRVQYNTFLQMFCLNQDLRTDWVILDQYSLFNSSLAEIRDDSDSARIIERFELYRFKLERLYHKNRSFIKRYTVSEYSWS